MARSTKGLYKRGNVWWMTCCDAIGTQRFEFCKTSNKKEVEQRLIDRRKEAMKGIAPAPPMKPLALEDLQERYLSFVGHQRGVATKKIHFAHFKRVWGNPPIHALTVEVLDQYRALRLGEKVGLATINREMATLKHALSKAVEWKLLRKTAREELTAIKKYRSLMDACGICQEKPKRSGYSKPVMQHSARLCSRPSIPACGKGSY